MFHTIAILALSIFLFAAPAAQADGPKPEKTPEELVTEGMNTLMQAMKLFMHSLPQFGEPYINENGDIVIPRIHPEGQGEKPAEKSDDAKRRI